MSEKIKKKLSQMILITCTSFTITIMLYVLIGIFIDKSWSMNNYEVLVIFAVCAVVAVSITIIDTLPIDNVFIKVFINFIDVFVSVFLFGGGILKMFPFKPKIMLLVFVILCIVFVGVYIHLIRVERMTAININSKIFEIKKRNRRD